MKGTDHFKKTILMYLEQRAEEDQLFAKSFSNPAKNIDDCVTYSLNYVKNSEVFHIYLPLLQVMIGTGLRCGELIGLTWKDVDLKTSITNIK